MSIRHTLSYRMMVSYMVNYFCWGMYVEMFWNIFEVGLIMLHA